MANYRKSFNFRNGVQVDDDNLVVNSVGNVGIGTTIPTELLDIRGTARVVGLVTATNVFVTGVSTFSDVKIGTGITISASSGIISATQFFGDGATLSNLPTSQWIDTDVGLGFTSIYAQGNVGVGTTDPRNNFQVGGNPYDGVGGVGINSVTGNIKTSGIVSATSFIGSGAGLTSLNASNISSGTIDAALVPQLNNSSMPNNISVSGIITATGGFVGIVTGNVTGNLTGNVTGNVVGNVTGNVTGTATTATALSGTPNIVVGVITATKLIANVIEVPSTGITTISQLLHVGTGGTAFAALVSGRTGIGTANPTSELQIRKTASVLAEIISDSGQAQVSVGQSVGVGNSTGVLTFGNSAKTFDIINRDTGNLNMILHGGGSGIGTGRFDWIYGQSNDELMSLTYQGSLGIGNTNPDTTLHVVGTSTVTGNAWFGGNVTISGTLNAGSLTLPSIINSNISVNTGVSTISVVNATNIGINSTSPAAEIDAQGSDALFGRVAIGTLPFTDTEVLKVDGLILTDSIGIGTTAMNTSGTFGHLQIYDKSIEFNGGLLNIKDDCQVGFNTFSPRSVFDFGAVGSATTNPYMIMPTITTSTRIGLGQTVEGAIIFNTTTKRFQGYTGTDWVDLH